MTTLAEATIEDYLIVRISGTGIPVVAFFARDEGCRATLEASRSAIQHYSTTGDGRNRQGLLDSSICPIKVLAKPGIPKADGGSTR